MMGNDQKLGVPLTQRAIWDTEKYKKLFPITIVDKNVNRIIQCFENILIFAIFVACAINIYIDLVINILPLHKSAIFLVFITG